MKTRKREAQVDMCSICYATFAWGKLPEHILIAHPEAVGSSTMDFLRRHGRV